MAPLATVVQAQFGPGSRDGDAESMTSPADARGLGRRDLNAGFRLLACGLDDALTQTCGRAPGNLRLKALGFRLGCSAWRRRGAVKALRPFLCIRVTARRTSHSGSPSQWPQAATRRLAVVVAAVD